MFYVEIGIYSAFYPLLLPPSPCLPLSDFTCPRAKDRRVEYVHTQGRGSSLATTSNTRLGRTSPPISHRAGNSPSRVEKRLKMDGEIRRLVQSLCVHLRLLGLIKSNELLTQQLWAQGYCVAMVAII